jgi:hypothetical protein
VVLKWLPSATRLRVQSRKVFLGNEKARTTLSALEPEIGHAPQASAAFWAGMLVCFDLLNCRKTINRK